MDSSRNHIRFFHALLYFYPAEFRHEYGPEMEQLFADRLRSESGIRLWLETLADLVLSAAGEHWNILTSDVSYAARVLAGAPAFTVIALSVIAIGIGSTTAVFSLVNAVLLRSLPYGNTNELVYLWSPNLRFRGVPPEMGPNVPDFYAWQHSSRSFSDIAMLRQATMTLVQQGSANRTEAALVTGNFFRTLQASPELGRAIDSDDDRTGHERVAVISQRLWHAHFGSDPHVIGLRMQLNRDRYLVIGVMPENFGYPLEGDIPYGHGNFTQTDVWLPIANTGANKSDRVNFASSDAAIGRLRPGVSAARAESELKAIESHLDPLYPEMWRGWTALVEPLVATIVGPVEQMLWLLLGAVTVVLLIAIGNVANLLFARATTRAHEIGVRTALGAGSARIVRQLLTESLLLSCVGGSFGVALAYLIVHVLIGLNPGNIPRFTEASIDGRVLLAALSLSLAAGLASGLAPALYSTRASIINLLRRGGNRGAAGSSGAGRSALVIMEIALSVVLLAGAGLFIRSYVKLAAVDPGFSPRTLTFRVNLDDRYSAPDRRTSFLKNYLGKLRMLTGVTGAGASSSIPLSGQESLTFIEVRGFGRSKEMVEARDVTAGYLNAMGTPLLLGRSFTPRDAGSGPLPVIVNHKFVETYFRGRSPLGQSVKIGMNDVTATPWSRVVGVVGDIRHNKLEEAGQPQIFQPVDNGGNFALLYSSAALPVVEQARAALRSLDPTLSLEDVQTMGERMSGNNARRRFQTTLMTGLGAVAVALALIGLYGLLSYSVQERTAEVGIRLALGSPTKRVAGLILWQGLRLAVAGLLIGLCAAFLLVRSVSGWLFGVSSLDPATFLGVPLFVLAVTCCACLIPAWTATRIDPVQALRRE